MPFSAGGRVAMEVYLYEIYWLEAKLNVSVERLASAVSVEVGIDLAEW
jgi:hypothetical protein